MLLYGASVEGYSAAWRYAVRTSCAQNALKPRTTDDTGPSGADVSRTFGKQRAWRRVVTAALPARRSGAWARRGGLRTSARFSHLQHLTGGVYRTAALSSQPLFYCHLYSIRLLQRRLPFLAKRDRGVVFVSVCLVLVKYVAGVLLPAFVASKHLNTMRRRIYRYSPLGRTFHDHSERFFLWRRLVAWFISRQHCSPSTVVAALAASS